MDHNLSHRELPENKISRHSLSLQSLIHCGGLNYVHTQKRVQYLQTQCTPLIRFLIVNHALPFNCLTVSNRPSLACLLRLDIWSIGMSDVTMRAQ